ncbi:F-box/kelch-repeat protein SKIP4 [Hirschfeldia incana]|nr:F-box/kelch-repeat protein SKIP4 [Hirschfeldia incana]KAJ0255622.1 F-box/kelch-repeat protein SKIP4 [Hirschfeldia incana]
MERVVPENTNESSDQSKEAQLITGVPDDILNLCLARVPREHHVAMKCVSRRWRDVICSDDFCEYRNKSNLAESCIYALCRHTSGRVFLHLLNPSSSRRAWRRVCEIPPHITFRDGMGFAVLGKRLFVLGGCGWVEDASDDVYCYDAVMNTWLHLLPPLSTKRCFFACETLDGKVMAIGGLGVNSRASQTWDIYDPVTRSCVSCSDESIVPEIEDSFVMDGKVYVRGGAGSSAAVYDGSTKVWERVDDDMASGWLGPAVVVGGDDLYVLDQSFGATLTMWCKETRVWIRIGKLSQLVMTQQCRLVCVGSSIFVIGKDCSTVVIDVENVRKKTVNGVMVCSSLPKTWDDHIYVITCKSIAI